MDFQPGSAPSSRRSSCPDLVGEVKVVNDHCHTISVEIGHLFDDKTLDENTSLESGQTHVSFLPRVEPEGYGVRMLCIFCKPIVLCLRSTGLVSTVSVKEMLGSPLDKVTAQELDQVPEG